MHVCRCSYQRPRAAPMSANYSTSRIIITARKSGRLKNSSRPLMDLRKVDRKKVLGTWVTYRERENADQRDAEIITIISDIDRGAHDTWWGSGQVREFNWNCSWSKLAKWSETAFLSFSLIIFDSLMGRFSFDCEDIILSYRWHLVNLRRDIRFPAPFH